MVFQTSLVYTARLSKKKNPKQNKQTNVKEEAKGREKEEGRREGGGAGLHNKTPGLLKISVTS